jgi:hypothetical protein
MALMNEVTMSFIWDDDREKHLTSLHMQGFSFSQIAAQVGCSRNAAIGKAHRLHLPERSRAPVNPNPKPRVARRVINAIKKVFAVTEKKVEPEKPDAKYRCTIAKLTDKTCRFPLWTDDTQPYSERLFCGSPGADFSINRPYCSHHEYICNPPK